MLPWCKYITCSGIRDAQTSKSSTIESSGHPALEMLYFVLTQHANQQIFVTTEFYFLYGHFEFLLTMASICVVIYFSILGCYWSSPWSRRSCGSNFCGFSHTPCKNIPIFCFICQNPSNITHQFMVEAYHEPNCWLTS